MLNTSLINSHNNHGEMALTNNHNEAMTLTSLQVAEMVGRNHADVMRDIRKIVEQLGDSKIAESTYFIQSTYVNTQNKEQPLFLLTKKGCELYSTRMTGSKGVLFAVRYIEVFNQMEEALKAPALPQSYKEALQHLLIAVEEKEELQRDNEAKRMLLEELKPVVDYASVILNSEDTVTITQIAKDYGLGAQKMNQLLSILGVQYRQNGQWLMYSKYQACRYTESQTLLVNGRTVLSTRWTQKGRMFLHDLLAKYGVLAIADAPPEYDVTHQVGKLFEYAK